MRAGPRMLVVLGLVAAIAVAGCTAGSPSRPVTAILHQPVSLGTAAAPSAHPAVTPRAKPASHGAIQNMVASTAVRGELAAAFAAAKNIPLSDVKGAMPSPGTVYYAHDPATNKYWAMAHFMPSATAPLTIQVNFQDGSSVGLYEKIGSGPWKTVIGHEPVICGELRFFPRTVLVAWSLPTTPPAPVCQAALA